MVKVEIGSNDAGQRLDRFLRKYLKKASLSAVYKIIRKDLKINGKRVKEDTVLKEGDVLSLYMDEDRLKELTSLYVQALITREEYEQKKKEILDDL